MNDHGLEQMVHFPTREKNTLDLILTTLPGQFQDVHSPDKLSDHDIVSGTLKIFIPPIKKPRRKVYLYQKGDYESMRKDTLEFAKEKYFNGHSDTRSVQENFQMFPPGFNCWFSSAPVFQWCCSTPQGSPGVGRNTFLSSPHLCFIIVFICDLFISRDDPLMS